MGAREDRKARLVAIEKARKRYEKAITRNCMATAGKHDFILVLDHLKDGFNAFNVPKIFRSAEVFGAHEIHLINIGPFDPAPSKGTVKKIPLRMFNEFKESYENLTSRGYSIFLLDPAAKTDLPVIELPEKSAFVFGHEEIGFSFDPNEYDHLKALNIPQYGQTQSLNVSVAASIVMYEYTRQFNYRNIKV